MNIDQVVRKTRLQCRAQIVLNIAYRYFRAFLNEKLDRPEPDTADAAGDDRNLACKLSHIDTHLPFPILIRI